MPGCGAFAPAPPPAGGFTPGIPVRWPDPGMIGIRTWPALLLFLLAGCATSFPSARPGQTFEDGLDARALFARTLAAHGGDLAEAGGDFNLAMDGEWQSLIQRIQPVVTDAGFRITAEERFRPGDRLYAVRHRGPEGSKHVVRTPDSITVHYNGEPETDPARLRATAMTTDAFQLFHFGPSLVKWRAHAMVRIADAREGGVRYRRLLATLRPGFGKSEEDQVVLWIHPDTDLLFRVHLTLNGFETTQGAHVDTTFLAYDRVGPYVFPSRFDERVRGPIRIGAHRWRITARDQDRGWTRAEVEGPDFSGNAARPAGE